MSSKSWCESGSTYTWCSVRSWLTFFSLGVRMDRSSFSGFKTTKALNMGISPSWISILSIHVILKIDCELFIFSVNFLCRNFIIEWILIDMSSSSPISLCILVLVLLVLQWLFYSSWDFHNCLFQRVVLFSVGGNGTGLKTTAGFLSCLQKEHRWAHELTTLFCLGLGSANNPFSTFIYFLIYFEYSLNGYCEFGNTWVMLHGIILWLLASWLASFTQ